MNEKLIHRMNRLIGQTESLKQRMATGDADCVQNIQQLKAVISGLKQVGRLYVEEHIDECLVSEAKSDDLSAKLKQVTNSLFSL